MKIKAIAAIISLLFIVVFLRRASAQTTAFTYQGRLTDAGTAASGPFQMQFKLFDSVSGGAQIGSTIADVSVTANQGVFAAQLDFGSNALSGANRWIEIAVRHNSGESYTTLSPREQLNSSPYSVRTLSAASADLALDSNKLGGVVANQFVQTGDPRLSDNRIPLPGSSSYVQNTLTPQASANFNIAGNGTAGSLNANGPVSLGGISPPPTAPAGQGRIYYDTASNKVKVSENSGAFVNLVGAGGVGGSGTTNTIPVWSNGTTLGNSAITQSGNGVQLPSNVQLATTVQGNQIQFGTPNSETGMSISGATGRADVRFDGLTLKLATIAGPGTPGSANGVAIDTAGNVGIGTTTPAVKLDVNGGGLFRPGGTGGNIQIGTPGGESGMTIIGTNRADLKFDGSTFKINTITGTGVPAATNGIAINTAGNVGIGTTTPAHRLDIVGGPLWTSNSFTGGIAMNSGSAIGWRANPGGQRFGIAPATGGLYFFRTASDPGTTGSPVSFDLELTDTGNLTQARGNNGLVKAMIFVNANGTIARCYNGVTNSSTGNCGFSVTTFAFSGVYDINFGFQVNDRFVSVTAQQTTNLSNGVNIGTGFNFLSPNLVEVTTFITDLTFDFSRANNPFMIILY